MNSIDLVLYTAVAVMIGSFILIVWMIIDYKINPGTYVFSMDDHHDCNDNLIYDEGHPEKVWKCTTCKKRY